MSSERPVSPAIEAKLELLPTRPGVYLMRNAKGEIVYIGKAVNLRNRVRSYFNKQSQTNHLASTLLRAVAKDLEWIITDNEVEALILEANLVNKHHPRYNVQLKDDKHFPYIKVTLSEPYPRLVVTRQAEDPARPRTCVRALHQRAGHAQDHQPAEPDFPHPGLRPQAAPGASPSGPASATISSVATRLAPT